MHLHKYLFLLLVLLTATSVNAQETGEAESESGNKKYVTVDKANPNAVVFEEPDNTSEPVTGLDYKDELEALDEEKDGYVKVRVEFDGERKEGWVKKSILTDETDVNVDSDAADAEGGSKAATASKGNVGMEPIDTTGMNDPVPAEDPWEHIDPVAAEAKLKQNTVPYHIIIPAGVVVAGGAVALALALSNDDSNPDPPVDDPNVEDPEFMLLDDSYSVNCGQSLLIYPLQNDVGTGLVITGISNAPEGVELLNDAAISIPSSLSEDVTFTIEVEDEVGQTGSSAITINVEQLEVVANNDEYFLDQGEVVTGNVLDNDLCFGCEVVNESGGIGILEITPNGDFQYFPPTDFWGEVVFTITIQNPCGSEDTSDLVFIISPTGCDLVLVDDTAWVNAGEIVDGNMLDNDICTGCVVTSVTDAEGTLEWDAQGNFTYTSPDGFQGQLVFVVSVTDACDQEGTQNLVIIVSNPPCVFDWAGQVETTPADCGIDNGIAVATEELIGPYNFSWSNGVEGPENENLPADNYQLYVTDTVSGCSDTLDAIIDELPPDYSLDVQIVPGECGATDNVLLFSNASPENPITIDLSGSTSGTFENNTGSPVDLSNLVLLNPGDLIITVWGDDTGPECSQSIEVTLNQAPLVEVIVLDVFQPQPPEPGMIVIDVVNALFPVEIFLNGSPFMIAESSPVFLEGLLEGEYEIFAVDASGCSSLPVVVVLESEGGIHKPDFNTRWIPHSQTINNWIRSQGQLTLQTAEGQDSFYPIGTPTTLPVYIQFNKGKWKAAVAVAGFANMNTDQSGGSVRTMNYLEMSIGREFKLFNSAISINLGSAMWSPQSNIDENTMGWFIDATSVLNWKSIPGQFQMGFRAGIIERSTQLTVVPGVQYSF